MKVPVLMYHRVGPPGAGKHPELNVAPEQFRREISAMASLGFTGISPAQWLDHRRGRGSLPERPVVISFDDAYAALDEHALPVLEAHGYACVVFVATALLGRRTPWDGEAIATRAMIAEWSRRGVEMGGHTRTHPDLTRLAPDQAAGEVDAGADELAALIGRRPISFAYPSGRHDPGVRAIVSARFPLAFTCEPGLNTAATPTDRLHRLMVHPTDTRLDLMARLTLGMSPVRSARAALAHLRRRRP